MSQKGQGLSSTQPVDQISHLGTLRYRGTGELRGAQVRSLAIKSHVWELSGASVPERSGALKSAAWPSNLASGNSPTQESQKGQGRSSPQPARESSHVSTEDGTAASRRPAAFMSSVETGQMSSAETGLLSAVEPKIQMSNVKCSDRAESFVGSSLLSTSGICPVSTADTCPVSTEDVSSRWSTRLKSAACQSNRDSLFFCS